MQQRKNKYLISGGGTGGHIFPALSIANELRRRHPDAEIKFVGADDRMEMQRVPEAGYEIVGLPVAGFDRKRLWRNFAVLVKLWRSMRKARRVVRDFKPDIAIGVGGYASGPTLKAAQQRGVPTLLQEQNSYPGVTNKMLAKRADAICVAYEGTDRFFPADKITITGNPIRRDLAECPLSRAEAKKALGFDPDRKLLLVVGGSLGARTINQSMLAGLDALAATPVQVLWQTGRYMADACEQAAKAYSDVKAVTFINDMATAYRAADLVISRAGAGTISELELLGKPVILVPSPNVSEDHQRKNGQALVDKDAAVMILDAEAEAQLVPAAISLIGDEQRLHVLSENIKQLTRADAAGHICDIIDTIVNNHQAQLQ